ncbi:MAG: hypothetical protein ACYC64_14340 [Armatimonadota bacterium]
MQRIDTRVLVRLVVIALGAQWLANMIFFGSITLVGQKLGIDPRILTWLPSILSALTRLCILFWIGFASSRDASSAKVVHTAVAGFALAAILTGMDAVGGYASAITCSGTRLVDGAVRHTLFYVVEFIVQIGIALLGGWAASRRIPN